MVEATECVLVCVLHEMQCNEISPGLERKACVRGLRWKIENSCFKGARPERIYFLKAPKCADIEDLVTWFHRGFVIH